MATYTELVSVLSDETLRDRVGIALMIKAEVEIRPTNLPTTDEQVYAAVVFAQPRRQGEIALRAVIAANNTLSVAQIQSATDAGIQTNVDDLWDALVAADAASRTGGGGA